MLKKVHIKSVLRISNLFPYIFCTCMGASSTKTMSGKPFTVAAQASKNTATLIFLHGLGDTGQGWSENFRQLKLKNVKCVCPNAPVSPVTLNYGMRMPSWFDIKGLSIESDEDEEGIVAASELLKKLIADEEKAGISSENIFVGGFSQGGAVAMYTALTSTKKLGGVIGLSTWLPLHKKFPSLFSEVNRDIPVFQGHGDADPLVPLPWGKMSGEKIKHMTSKHTLQTYQNLGHSSCEQEMEDVKDFLTSLARD